MEETNRYEGSRWTIPPSEEPVWAFPAGALFLIRLRSAALFGVVSEQCLVLRIRCSDLFACEYWSWLRKKGLLQLEIIPTLQSIDFPTYGPKMNWKRTSSLDKRLSVSQTALQSLCALLARRQSLYNHCQLCWLNTCKDNECGRAVMYSFWRQRAWPLASLYGHKQEGFLGRAPREPFLLVAKKASRCSRMLVATDVQPIGASIYMYIYMTATRRLNCWVLSNTTVCPPSQRTISRVIPVAAFFWYRISYF